MSYDGYGNRYGYSYGYGYGYGYGDDYNDDTPQWFLLGSTIVAVDLNYSGMCNPCWNEMTSS